MLQKKIKNKIIKNHNYATISRSDGGKGGRWQKLLQRPTWMMISCKAKEVAPNLMHTLMIPQHFGKRPAPLTVLESPWFFLSFSSRGFQSQPMDLLHPIGSGCLSQDQISLQVNQSASLSTSREKGKSWILAGGFWIQRGPGFSSLSTDLQQSAKPSALKKKILFARLVLDGFSPLSSDVMHGSSRF